MRSGSEEDAKEHEDWTDLESDLVQRGAGGPQVKTTVDSTTAGREQCPWTRRWFSRRRSEREHDHKQKC